MESNLSDSKLVIPGKSQIKTNTENKPESSIGLRRKIQIEPTQSPIIASNDEVVATGVDGHAGNPLTTSDKSLHERLCLKVVHLHVRFGLRVRRRKWGAFTATNSIGCEGWNRTRCTSRAPFLKGVCKEECQYQTAEKKLKTCVDCFCRE